MLLVGEGDFTFTAALHAHVGCRLQLVATSFDRKADLDDKYHDIDAVLGRISGASHTWSGGDGASTVCSVCHTAAAEPSCPVVVLHGVDATHLETCAAVLDHGPYVVPHACVWLCVCAS